MGTCLVTTLRDSVDDATLLKLDEWRIRVNSNTVVNIILANTLSPAQPTSAQIVGDGYFTNASGTSNLGKQATLNNNDNAYLSPGTYDVICNLKPLINGITLRPGASIDLEGLLGAPNLYLLETGKGCTFGDIKNFKYTKNLRRLTLRGAAAGDKSVTGNVSVFNGEGRSKLLSLWIDSFPLVVGTLSDVVNAFDEASNGLLVLSMTGISGNISAAATLTNIYSLALAGTNVTGNISSISNMTGLTTLDINMTGVEGNISSLANLTNLATLNVSNTAITGDTSSLANLTNLTNFYYANTAITGTWPLT